MKRKIFKFISLMIVITTASIGMLSTELNAQHQEGLVALAQVVQAVVHRVRLRRLQEAQHHQVHQ